MIFIDGQKIAKKLCTSISKETKAAKRLLDEYATAACELSTSEPLPSLQGVLSLESEFWMHRRYVRTSDSIPWKTKEELIQAYLLTKRCEEEECMLKTDMLSTVKYWYDQVQSITFTLQEIGDLKDQYELGLRCLLQQYKLVAELQHGQAVNIFSRFIQIPCEVLLESTAVTATEVDSDSSEESDIDSDPDPE